ncbi:MAG: DNA polymerase III subunit epsilon [Caulobacteraceae bacterium]
MRREIVLDTETTGIDVRSGHRLVEVGCIELEDYVPTGRSFHRYIDPCREVEADAERVHGLSNAFLADKPKFAEIADELLEFIGDAPVIAHNAPFDRGFLNAELEMAGRAGPPEDRWADTLAMARKRFPGMHNSLDALCKRFKISLAERDKHGALLDARLLAAVYLELQGGRERALDFAAGAISQASASLSVEITRVTYGARPRPLAFRSTDAEREAHQAFVTKVLKDKAIWLGLDWD